MSQPERESREKFFLTTPLFYVNSAPHMGSAYTSMVADCLARFWRLAGREVCLLTGVDEHGGKIQATARKHGLEPRQHCDQVTEEFRRLWQRLKIDYDLFSRTSSEDHARVVRAFLRLVAERGDIYEAEYRGKYCLECEDFKGERDLLEGGLCPVHRIPVQEYAESNYFFALSRYTDKILDFLDNNPDFIRPAYRQEEVRSWVSEGLRDFPISRRSVEWGIPLPMDGQQTVYVWFDALLGYLSPLLRDLAWDESDFVQAVWELQQWPPELHLIGKDILRFHAVYWIAMLMSAGLPLPKTVFGHGFLTREGEKMGKARGNVLVPEDLLDAYGLDAVRFYFLFHVPFGQDGDYSQTTFVETVNAYLANRLGNLCARTMKLTASQVPQVDLPPASEISALARHLPERVRASMESIRPDEALRAIFELVDAVNLRLSDTKPWLLLKSEKPDELRLAKIVLRESWESLYLMANLMPAFLPDMGSKMLYIFGLREPVAWSELRWGSLGPGIPLQDPGILFARI